MEVETKKEEETSEEKFNRTLTELKSDEDQFGSEEKELTKTDNEGLPVYNKEEKKSEKIKKKVKERIKDELKPKGEKLEMKLECKKRVLKSLIEKVGSLNDEITLSITKQGLQTKQVDVSHVAMVDMTIKKSAFDEYHLNHDCQVGLSLPTLDKHLKVFDGDITTTNDNNQFVFKGASGRVAKMGLLSVIDSEPKLPTIKYSVEAKTKAENILKMISVAGDFARDMLRFVVQHDELYILMETDTDQVRFPICKINRLDESKDFETLYSVDYLKMIMNFGGYDTLTLRFGEDIPMYVGFEDKTTKIEYLLAPRIEQED